MLIRRALWLILLLALLGGAAGARAQEETAPVRVDGRTIFRVGPADDADAAARAERIEDRLAALLENPRTIAPAVIEASRPDERRITVSAVPIVTITAADAEENVTTVDALAAEWAAAIDVDVYKRQLLLPAGGGGAVRVAATAAVAAAIPQHV